jgi:hypothetical protein
MDDKIVKIYIVWIIVYLFVFIPIQYWSPLALRIRHTFQLPSTACTNTLVSDLNSFDAVREGLLILYILIPFSACFMLWSKEWRVHLVVSFVFLIWALVMFSYDIDSMAYANVPPNDPKFSIQNLARDNRWCLYYAGQVGTSLLCANTGPCSGSPVDPATFMINGPFLYRFVLNVFILLMIAFNLWIMWNYLKVGTVSKKPVAPLVSKPIRYERKKQNE